MYYFTPKKEPQNWCFEVLLSIPKYGFKGFYNLVVKGYSLNHLYSTLQAIVHYSVHFLISPNIN